MYVERCGQAWVALLHGQLGPVCTEEIWWLTFLKWKQNPLTVMTTTANSLSDKTIGQYFSVEIRVVSRKKLNIEL